MKAGHDAFGRLLCSPNELPPAELARELRAASGTLQAHEHAVVRWLGYQLSDGLRDGADLEQLLRLPEARAVIRREQVASALARLVVVVGSTAAAARALRGEPVG